MNADLNNISKLDDEPNDIGGMTSAELKAAFDKAPNQLKNFINTVLIPALELLGVEFIVQRGTDSVKHIRTDANGALQISNDGETWENARVDGYEGPAGPPGPGAYETAVTYGYQGTEDEFNAHLAGMPNATDSIPGLSDAVDSEAGVKNGTAATPFAVKQAYDLAERALPKAGGRITGNIYLTEGKHYGNSLPNDDMTEGRLFFALPDAK